MSTPLLKPEFPPLLAQGFHPFTLKELRELCVTGISHSLTRQSIWDGLHDLVGKLVSSGVKGEVWADGSFLTEKIDPEDVDILVRVHSNQYDNDPAVKPCAERASHEDRLQTHSCDSYLWVEFDIGHPLHRQSVDDRIYWTDWFGKSRTGTPKGIAVIALA